MFKPFMVFTLLLLISYTNIIHSAEFSSNASEYLQNSTLPFKATDSYEEALQLWKTPEDVNGWIAANFSYDTSRAIGFSETQRSKNERPPIYSPSELFRRKTGVCVDLARFGVETLRRIHPGSDPKYLMIEFEPIQIKGDTFRLHWLVRFKRDGKTYFFADSKRPGHMAGPYDDTREFINEYAQYRNRKIVAFRELESYQKQRRAKALNLKEPEKKP